MLKTLDFWYKMIQELSPFKAGGGDHVQTYISRLKN